MRRSASYVKYISPSFLDGLAKIKARSVTAVGAHGEATRRRLHEVERRAGFVERGRDERIVDPTPFLASADEARVAQRLEMPGEPRLCEIQLVHQLADAPLAVEQQVHDGEANLVGKRVKELGGACRAANRTAARGGHGSIITGFLDTTSRGLALGSRPGRRRRASRPAPIPHTHGVVDGDTVDQLVQRI